MTASRWFRTTFISLSAAVLFAFGCGGNGGGEVGGGTGGSSGGSPQLTIQNQIPLTKGLVGQPYSAKLQATGGAPPYRWTTQLLGIGGLTLATDGTVSGTPNVVGTFFPTFTVSDSRGATAATGIEIDIYSPPVFTIAVNLPDQNIALPTYMYITVNGGAQPYTFSLASGSSMPPGLTFTNANGVGLIQGTPKTPGNYSFTVQMTDSFTPPLKISQTFTLDVLNRLVLPNPTLPDAVQNVAYTEYIQPAGGTPPYHFSLGSYPLPPGILLEPASGKVYGTPAVASAPFFDSFAMIITDSASPPASINPGVTLTVQAPMSIDTTSMPDSARGLNYAGTIYVTGGRAPYTVRVINGILPNGLTATASVYGNGFNVAGVPTTDGLFKFTIQVSDSYETPNMASLDSQIRISDQIALSGPLLVQILYNQNYSATFPATGGFPPYTWRIDEIIPGFSFDPSTGTLSGTASGGFYISPIVTVHDSSNPPLTANYYFFTLQAWSKLSLNTTSFPTVATTSVVLLQPVGSGGAVPYQWSVSSGSLPPGLSLAALNGTISGSPTTPGVYTFNLNISDRNTGSLHQTTSQQLTWTVKDRGLMTRNDIVAQAAAVSNISLLASISPFSDPSSAGPDVDVYSMSAVPGSVVQVYADANNDFIQPPEPNSLFPVLEIVDSSGNRYQTCSSNYQVPGTAFNSPCINGLNGDFSKQVSDVFKVPGTGTSPVTFYVRVSDARGDARPDFIYTFTAYGVD